MKTKHIYYIASLAMLTACTNNEEFETITSNGMQKVTFADPFVGKNLTRAESGDITTDGTEGTTSALTSFKIRVWGQEINQPEDALSLTVINGTASSDQSETPFYGGYDIYHSESGWAPVDGKEFYYPRDKYTFRFAAFAPVEAIQTESNASGVKLDMKSSGTGSLTFTGDGSSESNYGITNIPLVQTINNGETKEGWDLLVSNRVLSQHTTGSSDRNPISFTFQHILSRLSFYVYTTSNSQTTVKVTNITAYLPKTTSGKACYNQNDKTDKPTAETQKNDYTGEEANNNYNSKNSTWDSNTNDTWKWTFNAFTDIDVSTPSDFKSKISDVLSTTTYNKYEVYKAESEGETVSHYDNFNSAVNATTPLKKIGSEFFLAPTPAYKEGETDNVANYHFYVTVNYTVTEGSDNKSYYAVLPLYESDFYRFKQGWHHKLYLNLSSKKIRFISASVDNWGNHDEDMTVSREVDGWTSEQN